MTPPLPDVQTRRDCAVLSQLHSRYCVVESGGHGHSVVDAVDSSEVALASGDGNGDDECAGVEGLSSIHVNPLTNGRPRAISSGSGNATPAAIACPARYGDYRDGEVSKRDLTPKVYAAFQPAVVTGLMSAPSLPEDEAVEDLANSVSAVAKQPSSRPPLLRTMSDATLMSVPWV